MTEREKDSLNYEVQTIIDIVGWKRGRWAQSFERSWIDIRENDKLYNTIIDKIGVETIARLMPEYIEDYRFERKSKWDKAIRNLLYEVNKNIEN